MENANMSHLKYMGYLSNYYTEHYPMTVMNKRLEMLVKTLTILMSIDLSNNRLNGEIPSTTGNLRSLIVLTLSSNSFTGTILSSLRNLSDLELLALLKNKLFGRIPEELTYLTFLLRVFKPVPESACRPNSTRKTV